MRNLLLLAALAIPAVACAAPDASEDSASATSNITSDRSDPATAKGDRQAATTTVWSRNIVLHISDADGAGWASIDNGNPGDEVWLNRSFDGGASWGDNLLSNGKLGDTKTPANDRGWRTMMYELDDPSAHQIGALRACGKAGDRDEVACTPWMRAVAKSPTDAAADALMAMYNSGNGKWNNVGWWNSANALTALVDYSQASGNGAFKWAIDNTFAKNQSSANFTNDYMDDTGWWGLAWIRAYDLTGNANYLDVAKKTADYIYSFKDGHCNGGIWWSTAKQYKNAITNELFIKLAASLHNRIPGDTAYLAQADDIWSWFQASGMINGKNLINDGLDNTTCKNNNQVAWTYNQGVILGGLAQLAKAHGDNAYLTSAKTLADASTTDANLNPSGILHEPCEKDASCGGDAPTFKGVYMRNLGELSVASGGAYDAYLAKQASALATAHDSIDQYGVTWSTKPDKEDASRQGSALDALVANYIATK